MEEDKYKNELKSEIEALNSLINLLASLGKDVSLYALGGTAMVLAGHKAATRDIDFLTTNEYEEIRDIFSLMNLEELDRGKICNKWKFDNRRLDIFYSDKDMIMGFPLSETWKEDSKLIRKLRTVSLYTLSWQDIISTKLARGEPRDFEDILNILDNEKIDFDNFEEGFRKNADVCAGSTRKCIENLEELKRRIKNG